MKINIGFSNVDEIEHLVENGADEFHCGLVTTNEEGLFNHRPNDEHYNLGNLEELREAIEIVHEKNCKIYFLVNEVSYPISKHKNILNKVKIVKDLGVDGFIVASLSLIEQIRKMNTKILLSSVSPVFSSKAVKFVLDFGVSRVILPQHLNHNEVREIIEKTDTETEVFFLKANFCKYVDGLCSFHNNALYKPEENYHKYTPWTCFLDFESDDMIVKKKIQRLKDYNDVILSDLYNNIINGVDVLKIGLRGDPLKKKVKILIMARTLIELAEKRDEELFIKEGLKQF